MTWECTQWDTKHSNATFQTRVGFPSIACGFAMVDSIKIENALHIWHDAFIHLFISPEEDEYIRLNLYNHLGDARKRKKNE